MVNRSERSETPSLPLRPSLPGENRGQVVYTAEDTLQDLIRLSEIADVKIDPQHPLLTTEEQERLKAKAKYNIWLGLQSTNFQTVPESADRLAGKKTDPTEQ